MGTRSPHAGCALDPSSSAAGRVSSGAGLKNDGPAAGRDDGEAALRGTSSSPATARRWPAMWRSKALRMSSCSALAVSRRIARPAAVCDTVREVVRRQRGVHPSRLVLDLQRGHEQRQLERRDVRQRLIALAAAGGQRSAAVQEERHVRAQAAASLVERRYPGRGPRAGSRPRSTAAASVLPPPSPLPAGMCFSSSMQRARAFERRPRLRSAMAARYARLRGASAGTPAASRPRRRSQGHRRFESGRGRRGRSSA